MSFYDYKCKKCGKTFEINKGMNDKTDQKCPECGSEAQRVFYAPRILRPDNVLLNTYGSEKSGSCGTCTSGVCSSCGVK